jgi:hypothetical protein
MTRRQIDLSGMERFNDRRGPLFGREAEVRTLLQRADFPGVTTISAPH